MTSIRFDHPELLWLLWLGVPIIALGMYALRQLDPYRKWTAIGLRLLALVLIVCMLAGLQAVQRHTDLTVIAVTDQSESVRHFFEPPAEAIDALDAGAAGPMSTEQWLRGYLREAAGDKRGDDRFGMVGFDARPRVQVMPDTALTLDPGTVQQPREGTDIASALRTGLALFPADTSARLVLISDGNDTVGASGGLGGGSNRLLEAAQEARAAGVPIDVLPLEYQVDREVLVEAVHAPTEVRRGQTVALRVVLRATQPTPGTLHLLQDDEPRDISDQAGQGGQADQAGQAGRASEGPGAPITVDDWTRQSAHEAGEAAGAQGADAEGADPDAPETTGAAAGEYVAVKQIELPMQRTGPSRFEALFEPADGYDSVAVNNRAEAFTQVTGEGQVLFVDHVGGESGAILPRTLVGRGVELEVVEPTGLPTSLTGLQRYDAVVLQNVAAAQVTGPQQRMLARYVHDLGGGLIMIGGPQSFGAGGWANTEVDRVLPVESEIPSQTVIPAGALVLVIDRSGSMNAPVAGSGLNRQQIANEAAVLALQTLYPDDMVGVVSFDRSARWEVELQEAADPAAIADEIRAIRPGGGTHIYPGLVEAEQALARLGPDEAAVKHVIVLTDGMDNPGLSNDYPGVAQKLVEQGATLSTVGVGEAHEIDGVLLSQLAEWGDGTFYHVDDPTELPQIFFKEAQTLRRTLIRERTIQPQRIATGSPITAQLAGVPELHGFVLTHPRRDPRVYMPIVGPEGEPIFAHWQVGLGRAAAFTSDATNRWATDWLEWGGYADFWTRLVRTIGRPTQGRNLDLVTTREGDRLRIRLDATGEAEDGQAAGFADFLTVRGSVLTPEGETRAVELEQTGPGVYETTAEATASGSYLVSLIVQQPDGSRQTAFGGATRPPGEELRRFRSNTAELARIAEVTGGRWLDPTEPAGAELFNRTGLPESRSVRPLWRTLLVWLLVVFLLDVACRRIAWDPVAIGRWTRERVEAVGATLRPRRVEAEPTLAALKQRRGEVDARLGHAPAARARQSPPASQTEPTEPEAAPAVSAPAADRKFEADGRAKPKADIAAAVGGAQAEAERASGESASGESAGDQASEGAGTTSRLRAAKQRLRRNMQDRGSS